MSDAQHVPLRTCMGCGARAPQNSLLRSGMATDVLEIVQRAQPRGRSGYLHRNEECWQRFAARKGRVRSLGRSIDKGERIAFVEGLKRSGWASR